MVEDVTFPWRLPLQYARLDVSSDKVDGTGRYGRDTEVIKSSTVAAKRKKTPGMRNARGAMCESEEREEAEDAGKCISAKFMYAYRRTAHGRNPLMTSDEVIRGNQYPNKSRAQEVLGAYSGGDEMLATKQRNGENETRQERKADLANLICSRRGKTPHSDICTGLCPAVLCGWIACIQYQYKNQMVVS
jgi:hypothetical protein